jgi:hypothetical protein
MALEDSRGRGRQEFRSPVDCQRPDCPEPGVHTSRFEQVSQPLGPPGREDLFVGYKDV